MDTPEPPAPHAIDLSIIIVTWNTRKALDSCLVSLRRAPPAAGHEIIVVDNASTDGTAAMVEREHPEVRLLKSTQNLGFAGGNNLGAAAARGRILLFLNSDTEVRPGALDAILSVFEAHRRERPPVGAVGCRLIYPDGRRQRSVRRFPTFASALGQYTLFRYLRVLRGHEAAYKMESFSGASERPVEVLMGAALAVDRCAFRAIGGWDDGYFFGYEDADLCLRLAQSGYRCLFTPAGEVVHHSGVATKRMPHRRATYLPGLFRFLRRSRGGAVTEGFKVLFAPLYLARLMVDVPVAAGRLGFYAATGRGRQARRARRLLRENLRALTLDLWRMALW